MDRKGRWAEQNIAATEMNYRSRKTTSRREKKRRSRFGVVVPMTEEPLRSNDKGSSSPEESGTTTRTMTCSNCTSTGNVSYRPLANENGDFLCDGCYRTMFPATAMCNDTNGNGLALHFFPRKGGTTKTRPTTFPEEEECRLCLERGTLRRCCGRYYCHGCYHGRGGGHCPGGCGAPVHATGISAALAESFDPGKPAVAATWCVSLVFVLCVVGVAATAVANEYTAPVTVWGHRCTGWFPPCDLNVCVDLGNDTALGLPETYQYCGVSETVNKVVGSACVYDPELYSWSNGALGFDFCSRAPRENADALFRDGAYIFEDNFNRWSTNRTNYEIDSIDMASARWSYMKNAEVSDICGTNHNASSDVPYFGSRGSGKRQYQIDAALVFSGVHFRFADTVDLDVTHGGRLEFYLKMAPIIENEQTSDCKTAYGGDVTVAYSRDGGGTWNVFATYPVWKFRNERFTFVHEEIPMGAWGNGTRFRWQQLSFDKRRDFWALDDVKLFHYFDPTWQMKDGYGIQREHRMKDTRLAQCCYNTEKCPKIHNLYVPMEDDGRCDSISSFASGDRRFRFKSEEIFVLFTSLVTLIKIFYSLAVRKLTRPSNPTRGQRLHDNHTETNRSDIDATMFPCRTLCLVKHKTWMILVSLCLAIPIVLMSWQFFGPTLKFGTPFGSQFSLKKLCIPSTDVMCHFDIVAIILVSMAVVLDLVVVRWLSRHVFHIRPCRGEDIVKIDTYPDSNILTMAQLKIPLSNAVRMERFSCATCWVMVVLYILSGMPWATICLLFQSFGLPFELSRIFIRLIGTIAVGRALFGPDLFVKAVLAAGWLLAVKGEARDEMGRAMNERRIRHTALYGSVVGLLVCGLFAFLLAEVSESDVAIIIPLFTLMGAFGGLTLGMLQGLPVVPSLHLTRWPTTSHFVVYNELVRCPCIYSCSYCSDVHSRQILLAFFLDDMHAFRQIMIKGGNAT